MLDLHAGIADRPIRQTVGLSAVNVASQQPARVIYFPPWNIPCSLSRAVACVMEAVSRQLIRAAGVLARETRAQAVLVNADAIRDEDDLRALVQTVDFRTILITRSPPAAASDSHLDATWLTMPRVPMTRTGQVKVALLLCLARGTLKRGDRAFCLTGIDGSGTIDTLMVIDLGREAELFSVSHTLADRGDVRPEVFERALSLAAQLGIEGREGRAVGAIFVVGDSDRVLAHCRSLILNPFQGYDESRRNILDPSLEETLKAYSALDGAFIVSGEGLVIAAGMQLVPEVTPPHAPRGLGTRHAAAEAITACSSATAIVVSQSTGTVTVFSGGRRITEIHRPVSSPRTAI